MVKNHGPQDHGPRIFNDVKAAEKAGVALLRTWLGRPGFKPHLFMMEAGMSVGGVILPSKGFIQKVYGLLKPLGCVMVMDEVQT